MPVFHWHRLSRDARQYSITIDNFYQFGVSTYYFSLFMSFVPLTHSLSEYNIQQGSTLVPLLHSMYIKYDWHFFVYVAGPLSKAYPKHSPWIGQWSGDCWIRVSFSLPLKGVGSKGGQPVRGIAQMTSSRSAAQECWNDDITSEASCVAMGKNVKGLVTFHQGQHEV